MVHPVHLTIFLFIAFPACQAAPLIGTDSVCPSMLETDQPQGIESVESFPVVQPTNANAAKKADTTGKLTAQSVEDTCCKCAHSEWAKENAGDKCRVSSHDASIIDP